MDVSPATLILSILSFLLLAVILYLVYLSNSNIRKKEQANLASEKTTQDLQKVLQTVNEGFITIDEESKILEWNPHAERMFGWKKVEVLGRKLYDLIIPPPYRHAHRTGLNHFLQTGEANVFDKTLELTALRQDGKEIPVELIIFPLESETGFVFHAFIRDISQRKKAELNEARMAAIINSSDDAIVSIDLKSNIISWNPGAERLYGYPSHEIIGKHISTIYPNHNRMLADEIMSKMEQGIHIRNHDAVRLHKDGHVIPVSVFIAPIKDNTGELIGACSITRDISDLKKVDKMKNEFISIVSHELRTPLTSIRGSLGVLASDKMGSLNEKGKDLLHIATTNCERLVRLINDMLDIEKIESGKMEFDFRIVDIVDLVSDAIATNQGLAEKFNVSIKLIAEKNILVNVDYDRIIQVVTNLLSNAIRFSPPQETVIVRVVAMDQRVRVSITNSGLGIPEDFKAKIFGKFSQADSSNVRKKGGTGLGLNISKAIVEKHSGFISFESTPNQTTTFFFELPLYSEPIEKSFMDESEDKIRILICDHNFESASYIKNLLEDKQIFADIANTVKDAKKLLARYHYSAITLDLLMPDEDGISFIRELRQQHDTKEIPIVVISVEAKHGEELLNGDGFQVIDWIEKPIDHSQARKILDYIIKYSSEMPNILSIEDEVDVIRVIKHILEGRARLWFAPTLKDAQELLAEQEFDLVILDLRLPDGNGTALLPCVNCKTKEAIPVIVFSIDELDKKYAHLVNQALLKSKATNEQLLNAILSAINTRKKLCNIDH